LKKIEDLNRYGKFLEVNNWFKKNKLTSDYSKKEFYMYKILYCDTLSGLGKNEEALQLINEVLTNLSNENLKIILVEVYITKFSILNNMGNYSLAYDTLSKGFKTLRSILNKKFKKFQQLKGSLFRSKGIYYYQICNNNKAIFHTKKALKIYENLDDTNNIAGCLTLLGLSYGRKFKFHKSLELLHESLALYQELKNEFRCSIIYHYLARKYYRKGEPNRALEFMNKSLPIIRKFGDDYRVAVTLTYLIPILIEKGDYQTAKNYAKQSIVLIEKLGYIQMIGYLYYLLIRIALYQEDFQEAENNLEILYSLRDKYNYPNYYLNMYKFGNALLMKNNGIFSNKPEVEGIFRDLIEQEKFGTRLSFEVRYYLCELLLQKFKETKNSRVLKEIDFFSNQILDSGVKNGFVWLRIKACNIRLLSLFIQEQNNPGSINTREIDSLITYTQELTDKFGLTTVNVQFTQQYFELLNYTF
jgi:tetratricopeptide (TPR) repeat protein